MTGVYFSGTGNSKYCVEIFLREYGVGGQAFSIEDKNAVAEIQKHDEIVMGYPVQFSNIPKILRDFIAENPDLWRGKKVFIMATMGLFSGDGAGVLARLLRRYGAIITGGLHLKMPDSISDEKALKRSLESNRELAAAAVHKIKRAVYSIKNNHIPQEGIGPLYHLAGLFGQRLYFYNKTKHYSDLLKIDTNKCIGCGKCADLCPKENIRLSNKQAVSGNQCTMCYRCVSQCPVQAITLLGKKVIEQCYIEKYL